LVILIIFLRNRALFGNWSPLDPPDRIEYTGRRYYKSTLNPQVLVGAKEPFQSLKWHPGRIDYSYNPRYENVPTVIYLNIGNSTYVTYALSGGP